MPFQLTPYGLDALRRGFERAPAYARQELLRAATEAVNLLEADVKGPAYPVVTGATRASIGHQVIGQPLGVTGIVGSAAPVAAFIELGTKRMTARPFFAQALQRHERAIERLFEDAAGRVALRLAGEAP